jgi:hypothetical protein
LRPQYLSQEAIGDKAWQLLQLWVSRSQGQLEVPINIDRFINEHLKIPVLYAVLESTPRGVPLAKTNHPRIGEPCRITVNETLVGTLFANTPGLERTTLAHEAGHCVFHVDYSRASQLELFADKRSSLENHYSTQASVDPDSLDILRKMFADKDEWWREWQAHTFMRHILMPGTLIRNAIAVEPVLTWPVLYRLRERFDVTISALAVHLKSLRYIHLSGSLIEDRRSRSPSLPHITLDVDDYRVGLYSQHNDALAGQRY